MRASIIILSTLFSFSFHLGHTSSMFDEHKDHPVISIFQKGTLEVPEQNNISTIFFYNLMKDDNLSEQTEEEIRKSFGSDFFEKVSNIGWEAKQTENYDLAFSCMRLAAIGGIGADQEELAAHYLEKKDYKNAAKWYLYSALNNNQDVIAMLHRIDKKRQIIPYVNSENLRLASGILEEYFKSENTEH